MIGYIGNKVLSVGVLPVFALAFVFAFAALTFTAQSQETEVKNPNLPT